MARKKKRIKKPKSLLAAERETEKALHSSGYYRMKENVSPKYHRAFPDLSVPPYKPDCSNKMGKTSLKKDPKPQKHGLIVDTLHKQGMQVISKSDVQWAGGKKP